ncbi:MAG TPA: EAL domain-containing protein, partial [Sphaerochaeta sp.]|nr:EAL domain-containing protein [Sphaerochaeta sp.]
ALRFQKRLEERGCADYWVSINLSAFQLLEPGFANVVQSLMAEEGTNPEAIVFEHTESGAYSSLTAVNSVLKTLQGFGSRIALDDFGVGYSSLARESELNVDYVKIDKLFSDQIIKLGADRSVLGDVIKMIHKVDRITIVEGVEEERQLDYLKQNGCILYQGFLYSKPVSEEAALRLCT